MSKLGPIVVVEDDHDDQDFLTEVVNDLSIPNALQFFSNTTDAYQYLIQTLSQPFFILCDINLPQQNGIEFKKQIDDNPYLRQKSIPFIFFSTAVDRSIVTMAYTELTIQGFFRKENTLDDLKRTIQIMIDYWRLCKHPNN
jgi:CheY-like chemotaxis protein